MKGIEWIKLATCMCEDEKIRLIDAMEEERDYTQHLWIRLLLQAGKVNDNGLIYLKKDVPYTKEMLSVLFNRPVSVIKRALEILEGFKMIKIYENNIIKICNWEKHQNIEGMKRVREGNRNRVRNHREKKKLENNLEENKNLQNDSSENISTKVSDGNEKDKVPNTEENSTLSKATKMCNANVTLQREKREEDKQKKKKITDDKERGEELETQALSLIKSLEKTSAPIKGLTLKCLKDMLTKHKEEYVKMAINEAMERNKLDINYINGILKNWLREGYPKTCEESETSNRTSSNLVSFKEKQKLRFINFEPRQYDYKDLEKKLLGWKD